MLMVRFKTLIFLCLLAAAGTAEAQSFLPNDCVIQGGFCDASNTCIRYDPDADDVLVEVRIGTCDIPLTIDGPIDAPQPKFVGPHIEFVNMSRNGDLVVSANDNGLPGGTKKLKVNVFTPTKMATLMIGRPLGKEGSATFDNGTATMIVKDGDTIILHGGKTSDKPRNLRIKAMVGALPIDGEFDFTVFRVDAAGMISGGIETVLPRKILANSGKSATYPNGVTVKARTMRKSFKDAVSLDSSGGVTSAFPDGKIDMHNGAVDFDRLGHRFINEVTTYGGIVLKGSIVPAGIPQYDFSRKLSPNQPAASRESFNWLRRRMTHEYLYSKSAFGGQLAADCNDDEDDDSSDQDEDLIPKDSAIWTFDTPFIFAGAALRPPRPGDAGEGSSIRGIYQFRDWVEYGGVRVSQDVDWSWFFTYLNPPGSPTFVQDNIRGGNDNKMLIGPPRTVPPCGEDVDPDTAGRQSTQTRR
jgi:hypothetical protein